jgi:hypothetical protein
MAAHRNDPELVSALLTDRAVWAVAGLSANQARAAYGVAGWLKAELGMGLVAVHPKAEPVHGAPAYPNLSAIPDGTHVAVVDCFVSSEHVGQVVDEAIANRDRLAITAVWMQLGVVDEAAASRARAAGLGVVMDACPRIEWPSVRAAQTAS